MSRSMSVVSQMAPGKHFCLSSPPVLCSSNYKKSPPKSNGIIVVVLIAQRLFYIVLSLKHISLLPEVGLQVSPSGMSWSRLLHT